MKYYLHDTNSFNDEKITELFINYGYEGLGLFYTILEKIGAQEKPIKTTVLKTQLKIGKRLNKCWQFMEEIGIISSSNGETFNERILSYSKKYQVLKEKNRERVERFRSQHNDNEQNADSVTHYTDVTKRERNDDKVNRSKVNKINITFEEFWEAYGKKEGKKDTIVKWKLLKDSDREKIMQILPAYIKNTPELRYRKNPTTFLNKRVWEDEVYANPTVSTLSVLKAVSVREDDLVEYENGKFYASPSWEKMQEYRQGKADISIFDRKVS